MGEVMLVKDCMCKDIIVVDIDTDIYEISKIMKEYDIGFVPVNKDNKIVGVLTDRDIITRIVANKDDKITGYLTDNLISIDENSEFVKALDLMSKRKTKRLLVTKDNKLTGILSLSDLLKSGHDKEIIDCINSIYIINRNYDKSITKIDEFEL